MLSTNPSASETKIEKPAQPAIPPRRVQAISTLSLNHRKPQEASISANDVETRAHQSCAIADAHCHAD
jgi:hypothetical protein